MCANLLLFLYYKYQLLPLMNCTPISGPIALVVGGEEKGIRSLVRQNCDMLVSIPQTGRIDSLNASAAGAVAMYEIYRQRQLTKAK